MQSQIWINPSIETVTNIGRVGWQMQEMIYAVARNMCKSFCKPPVCCKSPIWWKQKEKTGRNIPNIWLVLHICVYSHYVQLAMWCPYHYSSPINTSNAMAITNVGEHSSSMARRHSKRGDSFWITESPILHGESKWNVYMLPRTNKIWIMIPAGKQIKLVN